MANVKVFEKWFKLQGQKVKIMVSVERTYHKEHMYDIPIIYHSKDMVNVKVFEKCVKLQGQGHKVKHFGTNRKILS
jgi:hypothetical protein